MISTLVLALAGGALSTLGGILIRLLWKRTTHLEAAVYDNQRQTEHLRAVVDDTRRLKG